jgi:hypothetical protein
LRVVGAEGYGGGGVVEVRFGGEEDGLGMVSQSPRSSDRYVKRRVVLTRSRKAAFSSNTSVPYTVAGYFAGAGSVVPYGIYPVEKFIPRSRISNSYCCATCTTNRAYVTDASVATFGFTPPMPAERKYVVVRSKTGEKTRDWMVEAALISVWGGQQKFRQ